MDHQEADKTAGGGELVISSDGGGDGGRGLQVDRGVRHSEAEYGRAIYCNAKKSGPM